MSQIGLIPFYRAIDTNGEVLPNARLYTFLTGTTTPQAVYTDETLDTSHGAYVQADANGLFPSFYPDPTLTYRYQLRVSPYASAVTGCDADPVTSLSSGSVRFLQAGTGAEGRTAQDKLRDIVSVADFGVTGDGATDDGPAMLLAINEQQARGCVLQGIPGGDILLETWTTPTLTSPFYFDGNKGTITCGTVTKTSFVTVKAATDIRNTTFTDWYRIISNPTGTTGTLDGFRFCDNIVTNTLAGADNFAYPILLQNAGLLNIHIHDNTFTTVKVAAILIGDNVYASQANWRKIFITNNTIDGVTISSGAAQIFGILVYGYAPLIQGNHISNVELGSAVLSASNGTYGIYVKAPYARVVENNVRNIGITATSISGAAASEIIGINIKGLNRGQTSFPVGFGETVADNAITDVGGTASGVGISTDHLGPSINDNKIERAGLTGISGDEGANPTSDCIKVHGNTVIMTAGSTAGISIFTSTGSNSVIGNTIDAGNAPCIRASASGAAYANGLIANNQFIGTAQGVYASSGATHAVTKLTVIGNMMVSGTYGFFANDGGGVFTAVTVIDNNFHAASTAGCGGDATRLASCRIRNNRGYVSEKGGVSAAIATGATIAHGLAVAPGSYDVTPVGVAAPGLYVTVDATNITPTFTGGGSIPFAWHAEIPAYWS
jgi:hypothetical protein